MVDAVHPILTVTDIPKGWFFLSPATRDLLPSDRASPG